MVAEEGFCSQREQEEVALLISLLKSKSKPLGAREKQPRMWPSILLEQFKLG